MPTLFIDGQWIGAADGATREIRCPADQSLVAVVDEAGAVDTVAAIAAARRAFDAGEWSASAFTARAALLLRVADALEASSAEIAQAESLDTGKRLVESEFDVTDVARCFRYFAGLAGSGGRVVDTGNSSAISRVVQEPVGVCGLITPWNYPLLQASWKVARLSRRATPSS